MDQVDNLDKVNKLATNLRNYTGLILVIDGDNTLWDTNSVFENAQRWLLESLRKARPSISTILSFEQLRQVDELLILHLGRQEYDFQLLVLALISLQKGIAETDVAHVAMSELQENPDSMDAKLAAKMSLAFRLKLKEIPSLLPSVSRSFEELLQLKTHYKGQLALILLSEGDRTRITPILEFYFGKKRVFDAIHIVERKSEDTLHEAQVRGSKVLEIESGCSQIQSQLVVVGDSITSDIALGNSVGAITIYIAGSYRGIEVPTSNRERPKIVLKSFCQLPKLVENILINTSRTNLRFQLG